MEAEATLGEDEIVRETDRGVAVARRNPDDFDFAPLLADSSISAE